MIEFRECERGTRGGTVPILMDLKKRCTQGEWRYGGNTSSTARVFAPRHIHDPGRVEIYGAPEAEEAIASCYGPSDKRKANAQLFSLANLLPDMAEALQKTLKPAETLFPVVEELRKFIVDTVMPHIPSHEHAKINRALVMMVEAASSHAPTIADAKETLAEMDRRLEGMI